MSTQVGMQPVDVVKWVATVIQLVGYGVTGMNVTPWNVYAFILGIIYGLP